MLGALGGHGRPWEATCDVVVMRGAMGGALGGAMSGALGGVMGGPA